MRWLATPIILTLITSSGFAQQCLTTAAPKDAIVLFDGKDTSHWMTMDGKPCAWTIEDGAMVAIEKNAMTKQESADCQIHVEFQVPVKTDPRTEGNGNSGVYVHGDYEIQVIDSCGVAPHPGHSCGAIYGQAAPMVDASLPAGQWQSFDIFFNAPHFDAGAKPIRKAHFSVLHNGIWIHDNREAGMTPGALRDNFKNTGPLLLQYHGYPVRYRNIWIRPLSSSDREEMTLTLPGGVSIEFVHIHAGKFEMGSPEGEPNRGIDEKQHSVTLTRDYWLSRYEVTNRQFRVFRPDHVSRGFTEWEKEKDFNGDDQPVVAVALADAEAFCKWVCEKTGKHLRLPTEAEWEYACRAGSTGRYCFGDDPALLTEYGWYAGNSEWVTHPVGQKKPNAWGLYDMHGNVAEWLADWYAYYPGGPQTDPKGPASGGDHGWHECSWSSRPFECRCSQRDRSSPGYKSAALGIRLACDP